MSDNIKSLITGRNTSHILNHSTGNGSKNYLKWNRWMNGY